VRVNFRDAFNAPTGGPVSLNGTSFCDPNLELIGTRQTGARYQWYRDGVAIDGATSVVHRPEAGTNPGGLYQLRITTAEGCSLSDGILIPRPYLPASLIPDSILACLENGAVNVAIADPPYPGASYVWEDGSTETPRTITLPGSYAATITVGCLEQEEAFDVFPSGNPDFRVRAEYDLPCVSDRLLLTLSTGWNYDNFAVYDGGGVLISSRLSPETPIVVNPPLPSERPATQLAIRSCLPPSTPVHIPLRSPTATAVILPPPTKSVSTETSRPTSPPYLRTAPPRPTRPLVPQAECRPILSCGSPKRASSSGRTPRSPASRRVATGWS